MRIERGLYCLPEAEPSEYAPLAEIARRVPSGVLCLRSALAFQHLATQESGEVWLALKRNTYRPHITPRTTILMFAGSEGSVCPPPERSMAAWATPGWVESTCCASCTLFPAMRCASACCWAALT